MRSPEDSTSQIFVELVAFHDQQDDPGLWEIESNGHSVNSLEKALLAAYRRTDDLVAKAQIRQSLRRLKQLFPKHELKLGTKELVGDHPAPEPKASQDQPEPSSEPPAQKQQDPPPAEEQQDPQPAEEPQSQPGRRLLSQSAFNAIQTQPWKDVPPPPPPKAVTADQVDAYPKNKKQARLSPPKTKPAPEPMPERHSDAKAIGHPLKLPDGIKNTDHPTVWFLAQRQAIKKDFPTFLICGDKPALVGFSDAGEMRLVPLVTIDKEKDTGPAPSWMDKEEKLQDLSSNLYSAKQQPICGTAKALSWIKTKSANSGCTDPRRVSISPASLTSTSVMPQQRWASARRLV